jgi:hypothetical protein
VAIYPTTIAPSELETIWVSAVESASSSFNWYSNKQDAVDSFELDKKHAVAHLFSFTVEKNLTNDEKTQCVDDFHLEVSRNKAFNESVLVTCYPFTADAWMNVVSDKTE